MSELWQYNLDNDFETYHLITSIYCSSISNSYFGRKKYSWIVKTKNNFSYDLEDENINKLDLSELDKIILEDAIKNLKKLKVKEYLTVKKFINEFINLIKY